MTTGATLVELRDEIGRMTRNLRQDGFGCPTFAPAYQPGRRHAFQPWRGHRGALTIRAGSRGLLQGVVVEHFRADRSVFVNTECCVQLNPQKNPDTGGLHWYCDAVAIDFGAKPVPTVFLCEVS